MKLYWKQILAYALVVFAAAFANFQAIDRGKTAIRDATEKIHDSQVDGCNRQNERTKDSNVKFDALYAIIMDAIEKTKDPVQRKQLVALSLKFKPVPLTNCNKAYPPVVK